MKYFLPFLFLTLNHSIKGQGISKDTGRLSVRKFIYFTPSAFSNMFSLNIAPVLTIKNGDTVSTETVDAAGFDKNGIKRQKGGNPLTGPFYIENAKTGDVLAVTLIKISLNRSSAFTTESFSRRSIAGSIAAQFSKPRLVKWKLNAETGFATSSDTTYEHLDSFMVPLKPFLGCVGVAPASKRNEILSFFQGPFGGNLDFASITQAATIYLPVFHDGAYLYIGDGHAVQGDGEIAGNALETSLDVVFTVNIIKRDLLQLSFPRAEDSVYLISLGVEKDLDASLKIATTGLLEWLQKDYHLTLQEATQVLSTTIEYTIAEIADPKVVVAAKIKKELLKKLKKYD